MARVVNMHEAKTQLSRLIEQAEAGEEIILARAGKPVARLVPIRRHGVRKLGQWKGRVTMADDFDAPLDPSELDLWEGGNDEGVA
jgi:prevent-host-death family protein